MIQDNISSVSTKIFENKRIILDSNLISTFKITNSECEKLFENSMNKINQILDQKKQENETKKIQIKKEWETQLQYINQKYIELRYKKMLSNNEKQFKVFEFISESNEKIIDKNNPIITIFKSVIDFSNNLIREQSEIFSEQIENIKGKLKDTKEMELNKIIEKLKKEKEKELEIQKSNFEQTLNQTIHNFEKEIKALQKELAETKDKSSKIVSDLNRTHEEREKDLSLKLKSLIKEYEDLKSKYELLNRNSESQQENIKKLEQKIEKLTELLNKTKIEIVAKENEMETKYKMLESDLYSKLKAEKETLLNIQCQEIEKVNEKLINLEQLYKSKISDLEVK